MLFQFQIFCLKNIKIILIHKKLVKFLLLSLHNPNKQYDLN